MEAWLIYYRAQAEYNQQYIRFYQEEGAKLGIQVKLLLIEDMEFGVQNNKWFISYQNQPMKYPDFAVCRAIYPLLNRQLEYLGIRVFNNSFVAEICNDKAKTYQYLAKTGIKMVDSSFYRNSQISMALSRVQKPSVIKAVDGHGGSQVFLYGKDKSNHYPKSIDYQMKNDCQENDNNVRININNDKLYNYEIKNDSIKNDEIKYDEIKYDKIKIDKIKNDKINIDKTDNNKKDIDTEKFDIIKGMSNSDIVVQPLVGNRHQDLRVYVIGKEIIASVLRTAREGFKANYSLGGEVCLYELSGQEKMLINKIIDQFDFGMVGIDFIIGDEGELTFNEIEDVVGARMLYQCSEINIVRKYLEYIIDNISSES